MDTLGIAVIRLIKRSITDSSQDSCDGSFIFLHHPGHTAKGQSYALQSGRRSWLRVDILIRSTEWGIFRHRDSSPGRSGESRVF